MIVTRKYIQELREKSFMNISEDVEKLILEKFGKHPEADDDQCSHGHTEQDIYEQIRKML
jgi:hypothetical protein